MFSRIVQFKIYGKIDEKFTQKVYKAINNVSSFIKPKLVTIQIQGEGSLIQAKLISESIQNYSKQHKVALYTFGEDFVLNSACYLMTVGDKNFSSEYSLIGDFGYVQRRLGYKQIIDDLNIQQKYIHSGEKKVKLSPYENLKEEDVKWMNMQLKHRENRLREEIQINRKGKVNQQLWDQTLITGQYAVENGLVDGLACFNQIQETEFKGIKTYDILAHPGEFHVPANATFKSYLSF